MLLGLLLLAAALIFGILYKRGPYSSPVAVRNVPAYDDLFKEGAFPESFPEEPFSNFHLTAKGTEIEVQYRAQRREGVSYPVTIVQNEAGEPAPVGDGSISLAYTGLAFAEPERLAANSSMSSMRIPLTYFKPDGTPVSYKDLSPRFLPQHHSPPETYVQGMFPEAMFLWNRRGLTELKVLRFQIFDARTHWNLSQSYGSSMGEGTLWTSSEVQTWRLHPVQLALTLAVGPVTNYTLEISPGSKIRFPAGIVRFVGSFPGEPSYWSTMNGMTNSTIRVQMRPDPTGLDETLTSFFFMLWPGISDIPIEIKFLDAEGRELRSRGIRGEANVQSWTVVGSAEDVRQIQVRYYPRVFRVITTLPFIPGMPEENRDVENLFDTRVPFAYFRAEWALQRAVENLAQMRFRRPVIRRYFPMAFSNGTNYPIVFTNATAADLFREMERWIPEGRELVADSEKNEIRLDEPLLARLWKRAKELIAPK